jgi:hypothetical protein
MENFIDALRAQRWDDHRYYHHSLVNQSLHFVSALSFVCAYFMMFHSPVAAAVIGWTVSMLTRQAGHFFFEPKGYDEVNQATHEYKEFVKVGYNLRRKVVLMGLWVISPVALWLDPTLFGVFPAETGADAFVRHLGQTWLVLGCAGLLFRTVQLFFIRDVQTGCVWFTKILTDPFNDIRLYHKAPLRLVRRQHDDDPMSSPHGA